MAVARGGRSRSPEATGKAPIVDRTIEDVLCFLRGLVASRVIGCTVVQDKTSERSGSAVSPDVASEGVGG